MGSWPYAAGDLRAMYSGSRLLTSRRQIEVRGYLERRVDAPLPAKKTLMNRIFTGLKEAELERIVDLLCLTASAGRSATYGFAGESASWRVGEEHVNDRWKGSESLIDLARGRWTAEDAADPRFEARYRAGLLRILSSFSEPTADGDTTP